MATEEGIIIKPGTSDGATMWVKTMRSSACEACSARNSCKPDENKNEMEVEAINVAGAGVGDRILLSFKTASLLKVAFLLYVFPVLCMISGAFLGQYIAEAKQYNTSVVSVITSFLFFGLSFQIIRMKGNKLARQTEYKPSIIRIIRERPLIPSNSSN